MVFQLFRFFRSKCIGDVIGQGVGGRLVTFGDKGGEGGRG